MLQNGVDRAAEQSRIVDSGQSLEARQVSDHQPVLLFTTNFVSCKAGVVP